MAHGARHAPEAGVGVGRKVGLPGDSSVGASGHVERERAAGPIADPEAFQARARAAYAAARRAVDDELARPHHSPANEAGTARGGPAARADSAPSVGGAVPARPPAT